MQIDLKQKIVEYLKIASRINKVSTRVQVEKVRISIRIYENTYVDCHSLLS